MDTRLDDLGRLILRLAIGGILLLHGIAKVQNGVGFVEDQLAHHNLPVYAAYGAYVGEVVAPVLVIVGLFSRLAGLVIAFDLFCAIMLARSADLTTIRPGGAWAIEAEMLLLLGGLAIACLGAGRFGVGVPGKYN